MFSKAEDVLHPQAPVTNLRMSSTNVGLIKVEGDAMPLQVRQTYLVPSVEILNLTLNDPAEKTAT